jgi:hypothetical protein
VATVKPTLRRTSKDYTQLQLVGNVVGLVHALGYEQAVIASHNLGYDGRSQFRNLEA